MPKSSTVQLPGRSIPHSLANQFLVAMPGMGDPNFAQTVTYLFEHNADGAMGIIINRPMRMPLGDVFDQLKLPCENPVLVGQQVLQGGPVQPEQGFVIHPAGGDWEYSVQVSEEIHVTTSRDILAAMARGAGPASALVALGYAGWGAGQLETELTNNTWINVPVDQRVLFDLPFDQRWRAAAGILGVDLSKMSPEAGHA
jgi:putative transcriptional regulator